jgi:hypothetical protein
MSRKINGWRRLWIVWTVILLPLTLTGIVRVINPLSEATYWIETGLDARLDARRTITDQRLLKIELDRIDAEYDQKHRIAAARGQRELWTLLAIGWPLSSAISYGIGAIVAWVRRGFADE